MSFTVEMLDSVSVENTERQAWLGVNFLRILHHVCLLLDSFEFSEQEFVCIYKIGSISSLNADLVLFLGKMAINCVIDRESFDCVNVFDQL